MDFTNLDSRAGGEAGAPLHILHPATGEPMMDGDKPCLVHVTGAEAPSFQAASKLLNAAKMKADETDDQKTLEDLHFEVVSRAKALITGFENIDNGDKPATAEWFLNLQMLDFKAAQKGVDDLSFVSQVIAFANDRANYLGNVSPA